VVRGPDGVLVGQIMVTTEWSDWRNGWFWWIQSVYVRPDARGRGVYRRLHREVEARARARGDVCGLRLYVAHENRNAQAIYAAMGMAPAAYRMYEVTWPLPASASAGRTR
jgi:ribosomal protein S18 acetylase RimI-like enzyme